MKHGIAWPSETTVMGPLGHMEQGGLYPGPSILHPDLGPETPEPTQSVPSRVSPTSSSSALLSFVATQRCQTCINWQRRLSVMLHFKGNFADFTMDKYSYPRPEHGDSARC